MSVQKFCPDCGTPLALLVDGGKSYERAPGDYCPNCLLIWDTSRWERKQTGGADKTCPDCGTKTLRLIETIPADDCNDGKDILTCDGCQSIVHIFPPSHGAPTPGDVRPESIDEVVIEVTPEQAKDLLASLRELVYGFEENKNRPLDLEQAAQYAKDILDGKWGMVYVIKSLKTRCYFHVDNNVVSWHPEEKAASTFSTHEGAVGAIGEHDIGPQVEILMVPADENRCTYREGYYGRPCPLHKHGPCPGSVVYVKPGDKVTEMVLPYSEVCMHMRVAGKRAQVDVGDRCAQIRKKNGDRFSAPILLSEAGFYQDAKGWFHYVPLKDDPAVWLE